jgi:glycerophosphoryl diester phosphodiesterase
MLKIAHRGYSKYYVDNSEEAILEAIKSNFDMIELDIQLCKTGEIIVYHDIFIDNKLISNIPYEELKKKNIITLNYLFKIVDISKIKIYLDLKGTDHLAHELYKIIKNFDKTNIYFGSFNRNHLNILFNYDNTLKLGFITNNSYTPIELDFLIKNMYFVSFDWSNIDDVMVNYCRNKNILIFIYTLDNIEIYNNILKDKNVDGIVSNILF